MNIDSGLPITANPFFLRRMTIPQTNFATFTATLDHVATFATVKTALNIVFFKSLISLLFYCYCANFLKNRIGNATAL